MEGFAVRGRRDGVGEELAGIEDVGEELLEGIGRDIAPLQRPEPFESLVEVSHRGGDVLDVCIRWRRCAWLFISVSDDTYEISHLIVQQRVAHIGGRRVGKFACFGCVVLASNGDVNGRLRTHGVPVVFLLPLAV